VGNLQLYIGEYKLQFDEKMISAWRFVALAY